MIEGTDRHPVGIIGAGGSGIVAAVALGRAGVDCEVLEGRDGIGGTWRYDPDGDGSACYASLVTNTSRLRTSLRSGRIPGRPWQYAPHAQMLTYLEDLATRERLRPRIALGWRVTDAQRVDDGWIVRNGAGEERDYRALLCALGVNGRPHFAEFPGTFTGQQLHSASYRIPDPFAGREVLIIGLGTSGCELAGELAGIARNVRVAVRTPMWMMTRRVAGVPLDWLDNPGVARIVPWSVRRQMIAAFCRLTTGGLHHHGVPRPGGRCGDDIIAISDGFARAVRSGRVEIRPAVTTVDGRQVRFADGSTARADVIIHATGFDLPLDFLPREARPADPGLYRGIAHPDVPDLYFVGLVEAHRALLPIAEAQAGWAADVISGRLPLPPPHQRRRVAQFDAERRRRDFGDRRPFLVDHARYLAVLEQDRAPARQIRGSVSSRRSWTRR